MVKKIPDPTHPDEPRPLRVPEAARLYGVSQGLIRKLVLSRRLRKHKLSGAVLVSADELRALIRIE